MQYTVAFLALATAAIAIPTNGGTYTPTTPPSHGGPCNYNGAPGVAHCCDSASGDLLGGIGVGIGNTLCNVLSSCDQHNNYCCESGDSNPIATLINIDLSCIKLL